MIKEGLLKKYMLSFHMHSPKLLFGLGSLIKSVFEVSHVHLLLLYDSFGNESL